MSKPKDKKWFILGAGGHARVVLATARAAGLPEPQACLVDDGTESSTEPIHGIPLLAAESVADQRGLFFPALGSNDVRKRLTRRFSGLGWKSFTLGHPRTLIEQDVRTGDGTLIALGCILQTGARIGDGVIINTGAIIEHDVQIADFCHIAPGSILLGESSVGEGAFVGAGSRVLPGVKIGAGAIVGAGSVVLQDVPAGCTVAGVPARPLGGV
jgi:sugar O-acyltransferase (sialic acid O-acetyltransferase NeuD family)